MKTEIINNRPKAFYTDDYIENLGETERLFAPLYEGDFVDPIWDGENYHENPNEEEVNAILKLRVPNELTPRQFKLALLSKGITNQMVTDFINNLPNPPREVASILWHNALTYERNDEMLNQLAPQMNVNLDEIFTIGINL